jgi:hypothetical protein
MTGIQAGPGATPRTSNPRIRASDADRDLAVAQLREHFAAGRLSAAEGQDRIGQALAARTLGELDELMNDVPGLGWRPDGSLGRMPAGLGPASLLLPATAADGTPMRRIQDGARVVLLITGIIVAAYMVTGLLTGIWWIPWALIVVPAAHLARRSRPPSYALAAGAGVSSP